MGLSNRIIGNIGAKFGISSAPSFLNASSAGVSSNNEQAELLDSDGNVIAIGITRMGEKTINYSGVVMGAFPEAGDVVSIIDPQTGQSVNGIVGADLSYTEERAGFAQGSFSVTVYPAMAVTADDIHGYKGNWDASTNTPTLANTDTGLLAGDQYLVSVDGSVDFGAGSIAFVAGDIVEWSGSIWQKQV